MKTSKKKTKQSKATKKDKERVGSYTKDLKKKKGPSLSKTKSAMKEFDSFKKGGKKTTKKKYKSGGKKK